MSRLLALYLLALLTDHALLVGSKWSHDYSRSTYSLSLLALLTYHALLVGSKWSHDYSRSIGTDVRYILFLVGKYDGAQWLVDEMVPHPN